MKNFLKAKGLTTVAMGLAVPWCRKAWTAGALVKWLCKKKPILISYLITKIHKILAGSRRRIALSRLFFAIPIDAVSMYKLVLKVLLWAACARAG